MHQQAGLVILAVTAVIVSSQGNQRTDISGNSNSTIFATNQDISVNAMNTQAAPSPSPLDSLLNGRGNGGNSATGLNSGDTSATSGLRRK